TERSPSIWNGSSCTRRERPRRCRAEQRDELAPFHAKLSCVEDKTYQTAASCVIIKLARRDAMGHERQKRSKQHTHACPLRPRNGQISRRLWISSIQRGEAPRSSLELACDKFLDQLTRLIGLRTWFRNPFVNGIFEQAIVALAAGGSVGLGEFFLHLGQHIIIERALHDEERHQ